MEENLTDVRDEILRTLLPDVPFDGWSRDALRAAAVRAGYDKAALQAAFPGGVRDVVAHFSDWVDREMLRRLEGTNIEVLRVRDRIRAGVMARLMVLQEHREAEKLALSYWTLPPRSLKAGKIVWRTADRIWNWAGDTATDYNHYTKRGLLSGVLSATMLAWVNDETPELSETEAFLDRRIENVMQLGGILGRIKPGNVKKAS
ncbi:MAG: COQ9 family protein [Rhodospirillales bacterium]|nr:COQ9 family protein [Rhodospirillales bacterium]MCB9996364.1 COQ9 family protein [Rhodospirillales bacterium]